MKIMESDLWFHYLGKFVGENEWNGACNAGFRMEHDLHHIPKGAFVFPRYTIQSYNYQQYITTLNTDFKTDVSVYDFSIANFIYSWYPFLEKYTFKTYFTKDIPEGQYVVKGLEKAKKDDWTNSCFAPTRARALEIADEKSCFREYVPLKSYGIHEKGIPISKEYRLFVYNNKVIYSNFYWATYRDILPIEAQVMPSHEDWEFNSLVCDVKKILSNLNVMFYTIDIAQDINDKWWLVEINNGHRSGIPYFNQAIDYEYFYRKLYEVVQDGQRDNQRRYHGFAKTRSGPKRSN